MIEWEVHAFVCVFRLRIFQLWRRNSPVCGLSVSAVRVHYMKMCFVPGMYTHMCAFSTLLFNIAQI